jgi:serine/threonine protein phosphatase 1
MSFVDRLRRLVTHAPPVPRARRAYAVGDIHGRLDLLNRCSPRSRRTSPRPPAQLHHLPRRPHRPRPRLGRRGRAAAHLAAGRARTDLPRRQSRGGAAAHPAGKEGILPSWLKFGGAECAQSYGLDVDALRRLDEAAAIEMVRAKVPRAHREFLESFGDTFRFGDYLFVHAGIRPGVAVEEQDRKDLRWIREPFLSDAKEHGFVVVHGHTIVPAGRGAAEPDRHRHRRLS